MRVFTAHLREERRPVLVREGFSWGAALFGPLWLLAHRAWIAAALVLCAIAALVTLAPPEPRAPLALALAWLLGLSGNDLRRWSLGLRGFSLGEVIAAPNADGAWALLVDRRPDLLEDALR